ncbi:MAG: hypothetical protein UV82_C0009G0070 [Candidatus Magasanikbacteria bacterium GW2011_GWD2_43_18]|uniref:Uncharacterized protein n=1 Tax=Candidatus Magasanikbacteria bacterium GW2011_GWE2_42_7 TaxID=1619052 RepID=A0A0G1BE08_9BACT|nr:MAG: hypothetical protein UV18_C0004G0154 [Candidatus Magasanikbacteria bacterium GW2011_GWC2_42_27]KKS71590.1 MAG: hypothetical protein UV42_C0024G0013 [Candidatus Magasanikbacteria bacterium GW2011_GWE2_42_7]KKT04330.1 MAG: hypothetical protein UV82_C0009G0070 [Candidatus Magasanikbacteria bacterium GW2011_GWD2_43_18]KKT25327.1 MAG: hypothetical protein UW10_C0009G0010 [Candidatus Magasanikbacteria bacterium GW2011_GWA2_43_9]
MTRLRPIDLLLLDVGEMFPESKEVRELEIQGEPDRARLVRFLRMELVRLRSNDPKNKAARIEAVKLLLERAQQMLENLNTGSFC